MRANRCMLITVFSAILVFFLTWQTAIAGPPEKPGNPGVPGLLAEIAELEAIIQEYEGYAPVPQTGQTICYTDVGQEIDCADTGQDGDFQAGVEWPVPRFTDNGDGTVTDNLTGLVWLKNANCDGQKNWYDALTFCNTLSHMSCGLSDSSAAGDWRLPNANELHSLIHYGVHDPALPDTSGMGQWSEGDPFTGVLCAVTGCAYGRYWSSTSTAGSPASGMFVYLGGGWVERTAKDAEFSVWPVRGGN